MKPARIAVLAIALIAAAGSALVARGLVGQETPRAEGPAPQLDTVDVLVAAKDIPLGQVVVLADLSWQQWPKTASSSGFIRKDAHPDALETYKGAITRTSVIAGEPINAAKLVRSDTAGFLSAILPKGMRAISIRISPESGAGGFILPNDRVDVIMTRREQNNDQDGGGERFVGDTVLTNVRVLAIDQQVSEEDGKKVVVGKTATVELKPDQAEALALAESMGELSLALRSLRDSGGKNDSGPNSSARGLGGGGAGAVTVVRYGTAKQIRPGN